MVEYKMQNRKGAVKKLIIIHKLMQSALSPSLRGMSAKADKGSVLLFHCTPSVNCLKSAIASPAGPAPPLSAMRTFPPLTGESAL